MDDKTCHFTSFLTAFQSYPDDGRVVMKGCVQWDPDYVWKEIRPAGFEPEIARSAGH